MESDKIKQVFENPHEEAVKIVYSFYNRIEHKLSSEYSNQDWDISKELAFFMVDKIISEFTKNNINEKIEHWYDVKEEILKI